MLTLKPHAQTKSSYVKTESDSRYDFVQTNCAALNARLVCMSKGKSTLIPRHHVHCALHICVHSTTRTCICTAHSVCSHSQGLMPCWSYTWCVLRHTPRQHSGLSNVSQCQHSVCGHTLSLFQVCCCVSTHIVFQVCPTHTVFNLRVCRTLRVYQWYCLTSVECHEECCGV